MAPTSPSTPPGPASEPASANSTTLKQENSQSRFHFLNSAAFEAPSLQKLENEAFRRERVSLSRVRSLENRLAFLSANIAMAALNRERSHDALLREVSEPLNELVASLRAEKDTGRLRAVEGTRLSEEFARLHVEVQECKRKEFESLEREVASEQLVGRVRLESKQAGRREAEIERKFEVLVGRSARVAMEERTDRLVEMELMKDFVDNLTQRDKKREQVFMQQVREVKDTLQKEREDRKKADERVLDQIIKTQERIQKQILDSITST